MSMSQPQQTSFNGGMVSPYTEGRDDVAKYFSSVRDARNVFFMPEGGFKSRAGTRFLGSTKSDGEAYFFQFKPSDLINYVLEFGNLYLRFWRDEARVVEATKPITATTNATPVVVTITAHGYVNGQMVLIAGTGIAALDSKYWTVANVAANTFELSGSTAPGSTSATGTAARVYEIVTPYAIADIPAMLATGAIESVDVLFLDADGYQQRKLSRYANTNWTLTLHKLKPAATSQIDLPVNDIVGISVATTIEAFVGAQVLGAGTFFLAADVDKEFIYVGGKATITAGTTAQLTLTVVDVFPLVSGVDYVYSSATASGVGTTIDFTANHNLAVGDYVERAAVGLTTPSGEIRRVQSVTDPDTVVIDAAFTVNPNTGTGWYKVLPIAVNLTALRGAPQTTLDLPAGGSPNGGSVPPIGEVMTATLGAAGMRTGDVGKIIKVWGGSLEILQFFSTTSIKVKTLTALIDTDATNPPLAPADTWRLESPIWSATRGWPVANEFHQGRLYHAGSRSDPTTIAGSRINNYENYATGPLATDAVQYPHASGSFDKSHWLLSASALFFGNNRAEVSMRGAGPGQPLGGDVIPEVIEQSFEGSVEIRPVKSSKSFLFVSNSGAKIMAMKADNESSELGKFKTAPVNMLARDVEMPGISIHPISVMRYPFSVAFFKQTNGRLLTLTNDDYEDVHAFCPWVTDGEIESHAVITHPDGDRDQIWLLVKRVINGATKRYIEIVEDDGHDPTLCAYEQFNLDCAIKITKTDTAAQTVLTGLEHLEAKAVNVMMYRTDMATPQNPRHLGQFTVASGAITLAESVDYTAVFEVGLWPDSYIQTLRPAIPKTSTIGHTRKWVKAFLEFYKSIPPTINGERMDYEYAVDGSGNQLADQGPKLSTGIFRANSDGWRYDDDGYVTIRASIPGPLQVLRLGGEVDFTRNFR